LRLGDVLADDYAFATTGTPPDHKTGRAQWTIPGISYTRTVRNWIFEADFSMALDDGGNASYGYNVPKWHPRDYGIKVSYQRENAWSVFAYFGGAHGRRQFVGEYGWNSPAVIPGVFFVWGAFVFQLETPFVNDFPDQTQLWAEPKVTFSAYGFTASLAVNCIALNVVVGGVGSGWNKRAVNFEKVGGFFQDMAIEAAYAWEGLGLECGLAVSLPLQKNALGADTVERTYGDGYGVFVNPYLQYTLRKKFGVRLGAYIYHLGNNPDGDFSDEQKQPSFNPFLRLSYSI
jgi:hypothetical protein